MTADELTHVDESGAVHMVDVTGKDTTDRSAEAEAIVVMSEETTAKVFGESLAKGDVLATVRIAGIMAAKRTSDLIPLAHPIPVTGVTVEVETIGRGARIVATVQTSAPTGVEMEALTAVSVAALSLYDMIKGVERGATIESVRLLRKSGGRSGEWER